MSSARMNRHVNGHTTQCCNGTTSNGYHHTNGTSTPHDPNTNGNGKQKPLPSLGELVVDPANACTLVGGVMGVMALVNVCQGNFVLANFYNMAANLADLIDGPIARSMSARRHPMFPHLGITLDAFSDLVSHFVVPASLLVKLSDVHPICTIVAITWVLSGVIRLSYVTYIEYGKLSKATTNGPGGLYGVTSDYMNALCAMCFHLTSITSEDNVCLILCIIVLVMIIGCHSTALTSLRYDGIGLALVVLFNSCLTVSCLLLWLTRSNYLPLDDSIFAMTSLTAHAILFYPTYLKYVVLNKP